MTSVSLSPATASQGVSAALQTWLESHGFESLGGGTWRTDNGQFYGFVIAWSQDSRISGHLTRMRLQKRSKAQYSAGWAAHYPDGDAEAKEAAIRACAVECLGLLQQEMLSGAVVVRRYGTAPEDERKLNPTP